jgi:enoyl-CoA hydratase/carnithine racemase
MISLEETDGIAVLTLQNPPANALDPEFMEAIIGGLEKVESSDARALIVTGEGIAFSAGADLFRVFDAKREDLAYGIKTMSNLFSSLFLFPKPTVAAVNGHAIAGGSVLTCACDYRVAAEGDYRLGFSELAVGVPFPRWALEILRFGVGWKHVRDLALMARTISVEQSLAMGLIDEIVPPGELLDRAKRHATRLARVPAGTYQVTKSALLAPAVARVKALGEEHDDKVIDLWASEEVQLAIREFLKRTIGKDKR